jgi:hypothetical protein
LYHAGVRFTSAVERNGGGKVFRKEFKKGLTGDNICAIML